MKHDPRNSIAGSAGLALVVALIAVSGRPAQPQSLSDALSAAPIVAPSSPTLRATPHPAGHAGPAKKQAAPKSNAVRRPAVRTFSVKPVHRIAAPAAIAAKHVTTAVPKVVVIQIPAKPIKQHAVAIRNAHAKPTKKPVRLAVKSVKPPQPTLDSMTRDGGATQTADTAQGMNIESAVLRAIASLAVVLAMAAGAIFYLRKKGLGIAPNGAHVGDKEDAWTPSKPIFGMSPLAQAMLANTAPFAKKSSPARSNAVLMPTTPIAGLEVLSRGQLPGSGYTLYKVRAGDRILLLSGASGVPLSVLTEWDVEVKPEQERRFDEMLDEYSDTEPRAELIQSAKTRIERVALRLAALGAPSEYEQRTR